MAREARGQESGSPPRTVKGLYLSYHGVGDRTIRGRVFDLLDRTELNAVVIDVKGDEGYVPYDSQVPLAREAGATARVRVRDFDEILARLKAKGIYLIARIVVFKDNVLTATPPRVGRHRHRDGRPLARRGATGVARPLRGSGVALRDRHRDRGGPQGIRRDPARLPAVPHRGTPRGRALRATEHAGKPRADRHRVPRAHPRRARAHRRLAGPGRVRVHRVQLRRHRHRPAHRDPGAAGGRPVPDGVSVELSPRHPGLPEPGRPTRTRSCSRPSGGPASGPWGLGSRCARGSRTFATTPSIAVRSRRPRSRRK